MALKVGELFASFGIKTDGLDSAISGIESKCQGIANSLSGFGKTASLTLTTPITLAAKQIYKAGSEFEAQMSKVGAISGATGADFDALTQKAIEMGSTTAFTSTEAGEALEYMAMAGWKTDQMLSGLQPIMDLAAASGESLGTTSDIVTDALTAFGLTAQDTGHFADVLAAASTNANTNVAMMGESFKYVAPLAGSLGYSVDDVAVALGIMANNGIKGSQAGTSLSRIIQNMVSPTNAQAAAMEKLGLSLTDSKGNMKSLKAVMGDMRLAALNANVDLNAMQEAVAELDAKLESGTISEEEYVKLLAEATGGSTDFLQAVSDLAGARGLSGMLSIMNTTEADFGKLTEAIRNCDGAASEMAARMLANVAGDVTLFKSAVEGLEVSLFNLASGSMREVIQKATEIVNAFHDADSATQLATMKMAGLAAAAGPVALGLSKIVSFLPKIVPMLKGMIGPFGIVTGTMALFAAAAIDANNDIGRTFTAAMTTVGKQAKVYKKNVLSTMQTISKRIPRLVKSINTGLKLGLPGIIDALSETLHGALNVIADNASSVISIGQTIITKLSEGLRRGLPNLIPAAINVVSSIASAMISNIPVLIEAAGNLVTGIWEGLKNTDWGAVGKQLLESIGSAIKGSASIISGMFADIKASFQSANWSEIGQNLWNAIKSGIKYTGDWLKDVLGYTPDTSWSQIGAQLWSTIKSGISDAGDWLKTKLGYSPDASWSEIGGAIWGHIKDGIKTVASGDWLKQLVLGDSYTPDASWEQVGSAVWEAIKNGISDTGDWLKTKLGYEPSTSWASVGQDLWTKIKTGIFDIGDWLKTKLGYEPTTAWTTVGKDLWGKIKDGISDTGDWLKGLVDLQPDATWGEFGAAIWDAIKNGISAAGDWLKEKIGFDPDTTSWGEIGGRIWDTIKGGISATGDWLMGKIGFQPGESWKVYGLRLWWKIKEGISATGDWLKAKLKYSPDTSWSEIGADLWGKIKSGIKDSGDWLKTKLGYHPTDSWITIGAELWKKIKSGIVVFGDWLKTKLNYSPSDSWTTVGSDLWGKIKDGIEDTSDWLKTALDYHPDDSWVDIGGDIWEKIETGISTAAQNLDEALGLDGATSSIWESIKSIFSDIAESIGAIFSAFSDTATIEAAGNTLDGTFRAAVEAIAAALKSIEGVVGVITDIISKANDLGVLDEAIKGIAGSLILIKSVNAINHIATLFKSFATGVKVLGLLNPKLLLIVASVAAIVAVTKECIDAWNKLNYGMSETEANEMGFEGIARKFDQLAMYAGSASDGIANLGDEMRAVLEDNAAFSDSMLETLNNLSEQQWQDLWNIWAQGGDVVKNMTDYITELQGVTESTEIEMPEIQGLDQFGIEIEATDESVDQLLAELDLLNGTEVTVDASGVVTAVDEMTTALSNPIFTELITNMGTELTEGQIDLALKLSTMFQTIMDEGISGEERAKTLFALMDLGIEPAILDNIPSYSGEIEGAIQSLVDSGVITMEEGYEALGKIIPNSMKTGIDNGIPEVEGAAKQIGDIAATANEQANIEATAKESGEKSPENLKAGMESKASEPVDAMGTIVDDIEEKALTLTDKLQDASEDGTQAMTTAIETESPNAVSAMESMATEIVNAALNQMTYDVGFGIGQTYVNAVETGLGSGNPHGKMASIAKQIIGNARQALSNTIGYSIGLNFAQGLANGILAGGAGVATAAATVAASAAAAAMAKLQIGSPSRLARDEIGAMFDKGLALGLLDNRSTIVSAANQVTDALRDSFYVGDPSHGTVYTSRESARATATQTAQASGAGGSALEHAKEIGAAIADRLITSGVLDGDMYMDKEAVGRKVAQSSKAENNRVTNRNVAGRSLQGVLT